MSLQYNKNEIDMDGDEHQVMEPYRFLDGRARNGSCVFWINCGKHRQG